MSARRTAGEPYQAGEPRVQLLPPLVKQRERSRRTRRLLAFVVVVSIGVALAGVAFGYLRAVQAEAALAAERMRTEQIQAEQAEYAEAAQKAALVEASEQAQRQVTANEIDWLDLISEIGAYVPAGAAIDLMAFSAPAPWEPPLVPEGELREPRVAIVNLTIGSADYSLAAAFVREVWNMEGVADVVITGTTIDAGRYLTTITLTLNEQVRADRFLDDGAEDSDEGEADPQPGETPAPEETTEVDE
jgi:type II secretory pathway pseudopilin PulG